MLLDSGVCTVYKRRDVSAPGDKPAYDYEQVHESCYAELAYETAPDRPTAYREEVRIDARIRVLQCRRITNHDTVVLRDARHVEPGAIRYEVRRAYHGHDEESGEPITDITLTEVGTWS